MALTAKEVRDICLELGFVEVQAAGFFRWYEYPPPRARREAQAPAYARVLFYEPRSEMQVWVVAQRNGASSYRNDDSEYVETKEDVERMLRAVASLRHHVAIEELVKWDDERLAALPPEMLEAARSPRQEERLPAEMVIADWLLNNGVPF